MSSLEDEKAKQPLSRPRVLVTGASGFIGSGVVGRLASEGIQVVASGRSTGRVDGEVQFIASDVTRPETLSSVVKGVDVVVHAAGLAHQFGKDPASLPFANVNVDGTANTARAAVDAGVKQFVLISSVAVYGPHAAIMCDEDAPCRPVEPYSVSKYESEKRAIEILRDSGTGLTILRVATAYGEGDPGNLIRLIRAIDRGRFIWLGKGENRKSLIHRDDVAGACLLAVRKALSGVNIYNVTGGTHQMSEIVNAIASALRRRVPEWRIPNSAAESGANLLRQMSGGKGTPGRIARTIEKWLDDDAYDGGKFNRTIGFQPAVRLQDGMQREVEWYRGKGVGGPKLRA